MAPFIDDKEDKISIYLANTIFRHWGNVDLDMNYIFGIFAALVWARVILSFEYT